MLKSLGVRDFAVLAEAEVRFQPGLSVFTGETGAGKSLLIEALGFLFGERGSADWIRAGAERLEVRGVFDQGDFPESLRKAFNLTGPEAVLLRELDRSGRTRATLGGRPVPAAALREAGERMADFHGQHEHQTLLKPALQMELLDGFGGHDGLRAKAAAAFAERSRLKAELAALAMSEEERLRRVDLCRFQVDEIDGLAPRPGEDEELEAELPRLKNAARLIALAEEACERLERQEGSAGETLSRAAKAAAEIARLDGSLSDAAQALERSLVDMREAAARLSDYRARIEERPERLDEVLTRLDRLAKLRKKYGPSLADVLAFRDKAAAELRALETREETEEDLQAALEKAEKKLSALCEELHEARMKTAKRLAERAASELKDLGMPGARFSVSVEMEEGAFSASGADQVEFLIAPNPGEPLKSLRAIASGGEISRVMLALKTVLAREDRVRLLVFDEVDSGVGGATARAVGRKLFEIARSRQVLCVTHLPQVACFAAGHHEVTKRTAHGRTAAQVERLEGERRLEALARMLGGPKVTEAGRRHAQELLESI
ncbi:MAG TPA: DNA repair protein RecN [Elusimicrobia bacterium]|nr:DNA repair protein RecN [Elusimicrobiota bacterium]